MNKISIINNILSNIILLNNLSIILDLYRLLLIGYLTTPIPALVSVLL